MKFKVICFISGIIFILVQLCACSKNYDKSDDITVISEDKRLISIITAVGDTELTVSHFYGIEDEKILLFDSDGKLRRYDINNDKLDEIEDNTEYESDSNNLESTVLADKYEDIISIVTSPGSLFSVLTVGNYQKGVRGILYNHTTGEEKDLEELVGMELLLHEYGTIIISSDFLWKSDNELNIFINDRGCLSLYTYNIESNLIEEVYADESNTQLYRFLEHRYEVFTSFDERIEKIVKYTDKIISIDMKERIYFDDVGIIENKENENLLIYNWRIGNKFYVVDFTRGKVNKIELDNVNDMKDCFLKGDTLGIVDVIDYEKDSLCIKLYDISD